jgi:hypothetical protein
MRTHAGAVHGKPIGAPSDYGSGGALLDFSWVEGT